MIAVLALAFLVLLVLTTPIGVAMGLASAAALSYKQSVPLTLIPVKLVEMIDSFVLLAIPLFIFVGVVMDRGGITGRLVNLAKVFVGHVRGGLAMTVVVGEMFFSGISGSTVADVSAVGSLLLPAMRRIGYKPEYAVSVVSAASAMGILIPPCIMMVVLGDLAGVSVGALFLGGFVPATVLALMVMGLIYYHARRYGLPAEKRPTWGEFFGAIFKGVLPAGFPLIVFGGIFTGVFTATEAAAVAVVYGIVLATFVYRLIGLKELWEAAQTTAVLTGAIMLLVGFAATFSFILAMERVPEAIGGSILSLSRAPWFFLVVVSAVFVVIGSALERLPALIIFIPVFMPLVRQLGIDSIHFGIIVIAAVGIGLFLPPLGIGLLIGCGIGNTNVSTTLRSFIPFLLVLIMGLLILILVPWFATVVPALAGIK